jgi:hypothetical protein
MRAESRPCSCTRCSSRDLIHRTTSPCRRPEPALAAAQVVEVVTAIASRVVANQRYQVIVVELGRGLNSTPARWRVGPRRCARDQRGVAQCNVEVPVCAASPS